MQPNRINNHFYSKFVKYTLALALAYVKKIHPNLICLDWLNLAILQQQTLEYTNLQKQTPSQSRAG